VIAGNAEAVDRACEILKEMGAKRAIKLPVSAPFHCSLMMPAQERLSRDLRELNYSKPLCPVVHNVDALANFDASAVCDKLIQQVSSPVRWLQTVELLRQEGATKFVEIGPGKVLSGLVRQIDREAETANIEDPASLSNTLASIS
jgi:[acyl-carrier-protein] S-malonyltransferase